jgi:hypothetical protein
MIGYSGATFTGIINMPYCLRNLREPTIDLKIKVRDDIDLNEIKRLLTKKDGDGFIIKFFSFIIFL